MASSKSKGGTTRTINKSAITGRIVSNANAAQHPKTTYKQTIKKK